MRTDYPFGFELLVLAIFVAAGVGLVALPKPAPPVKPKFQLHLAPAAIVDCGPTCREKAGPVEPTPIAQ